MVHVAVMVAVGVMVLLRKEWGQVEKVRREVDILGFLHEGLDLR